MKLRQFNKIILPIYIYIFVGILYFNYRTIDSFVYSFWNSIIFIFVIFVFPIILLIWLFFRYKSILKKERYLYIFLISLIPGFLMGGFIALGMWILAHAYKISDLLLAILIYGIPLAIIFGLIGIIINFIFNKFKKS